jgi:cytoskeletal protein RodZ
MKDTSPTTDNQPATGIPIPDQTAINPSLETTSTAAPPEPEAILPPPVVNQSQSFETPTVKRSWLSVPIAMIIILLIVVVIALVLFFINRNNLTYTQTVPTTNAATTSHQSKLSAETISVNCGSKNCFNQKFASCSPATESIVPEGDGTASHFTIYGPKAAGCKMQLIYTNSTISTWDNQPLVCNFDNKQPVNVAVAEALYTLSQNTNPYNCSGSFISVYQTSLKATSQSTQNNTVNKLTY